MTTAPRASVALGRADEPLHHRESVMGTVVTITLWPSAATDPRAMWTGLARARAILQRADAVFSTWKRDSPLSRLRRGEVDLADCPSDVAAVLALCAEIRDRTNGWFDPWAMPGGVDPTGLVKGWAAERAIQALEGLALEGAIVNAAGDVATIGSNPDGSPFRIGITDPRRRGRLACVAAASGAIATSGTAEQRAHLVDPRTATPCARVASATVAGPSLAVADALATAVAVAGEGALAIVEAFDGYEALTISLDGIQASTRAFPFVEVAPRVGAG
jgi:thiamine biosynthesis lipoprotein